MLGSLLAVALTSTIIVTAGAPALATTGSAGADATELAAVELAAAALPDPRPPVAFTTAPESPSPYQGQVSCDPVEKPGPTAVRQLLLDTYGKANAAGIARSCSVGGTSEHKEGRAYDWMVDSNDATDKAKGDAFVAWLSGADAQGVAGGNAHRLGIQYVIWNKRTWQSWTGKWKAYTGASPHADHVHISFSWDGAMKRTSWWTGKAVTNRDIGPCALYIGEPMPRYTTPNYGKCPAPVPRAYTVVTADFDGDGRDDVGSYSRGVFVLRTATRTYEFAFGRNGDLPVAGDWNGDGKAGVGVFRNGAWHLRDALSAGPAASSFGFGRAGDRPVVGAWDGDRTGIGVVRGNRWFLRPTASKGNATAAPSLGRASDVPVVGDWDGNRKDDIGVFRAGVWHQASNSLGAGPVRATKFGYGNGQPGAGDWNGDRRTTFGTAKASEFALTDDPNGGGLRTMSVPF